MLRKKAVDIFKKLVLRGRGDAIEMCQLLNGLAAYRLLRMDCSLAKKCTVLSKMPFRNKVKFSLWKLIIALPIFHCTADSIGIIVANALVAVFLSFPPSEKKKHLG